MGILEILLISLGLAMDAFAVSICKGLSMNKINIKKMLLVGAYFGFFQALMPLIGYFLGRGFEVYVIQIDHWIAFILLLFIGTNMIREAFDKDKDENNNDTSLKTMLILSIATSIDALAVGITFAFLGVNIFTSILTIGTVTFITSCIGVIIGGKFGNKYEKRAEIFGGVILIIIGLKILIEHLYIG